MLFLKLPPEILCKFQWLIVLKPLRKFKTSSRVEMHRSLQSKSSLLITVFSKDCLIHLRMFSLHLYIISAFIAFFISSFQLINDFRVIFSQSEFSFITRPVCKYILHIGVFGEIAIVHRSIFLKSKCFSKLFRELANLSALRGCRLLFYSNLKSWLHFPNSWAYLLKIEHLWGCWPIFVFVVSVLCKS